MGYRKIILFLLFVGVIIALRFTPLADYFTLANLQLQKEYLKDLVQGNYALSVFLFILIYCLAAALSIPGAAILTMAGGLLFGVLPAALYVNLGATTGAVGAFFVSRYLLGSAVQERYADKLRWFNREISTHGHSYLLVLRLIPIFPFFLINVCAGLTNVSLKTFFWTTAIGIVPGSFLFTFAGKQLDYVTKASDILSGRMLLAFALLALFALLPVVIKKMRDTT